ncbi:MAG: efflux RND transporter periplasmic adaptor subunit [Bacteroidales bacterium]|nr:efflux RND transporter periplasmic adaptor subunit [Bacteroidales bacterium]
MKTIRLFAIALIGMTIVSGCNQGKSSAEAEGGAGISQETVKAIPVRVMSLEKETIARTIDYTATLQAWEELYIAPASPGRIEEIFVEPGDYVKEGARLFRMDETQLKQTEIQLASMAVDLQRMETLLETGSITQSAYDQLKTSYDVTRASLGFLKENTTMKAPFTGVVTGKYFENGEIYSGAPNTQAGKAAVLTLMQVNPLKALVNVSEQHYPMVSRGMDVEIVSDVYAGSVIKGRVVLVYPVIDPLSRSFRVEVEVPNASGDLKPGMYTRVSMMVGEEETFVVPSNVVLQQEGTNERYLFMEENGVARRINVTIGKRFDEKVEIVSDMLTSGSRIIINGQSRLMDGMKVDVVK